MATLRECHDALEARLATISGLRTFNHPPQGTTPPVAFMVHTGWTMETMSRSGMATLRFDVYVMTGETTRPVDGYHALLEYADLIGEKSIRAAIWDGMVNGLFAGLPGTTAQVTEFRVLGQTEMDAIQMYGGVFTVEIRTTPT